MRPEAEARPLEQTLAWLAAAVASSTDAIFSQALDGTITSWNAGAERIYDHLEADMVGANAAVLFPPGRGHELRDILARVAAGEALEPFETERQRGDGRVVHVSVSVSPLRDAAGTVVGALAIARDVTAKKLDDERILHHAFHDPLTSLPNRLLLDDRLSGALTRAARSGQTVGVLFIDLDHFKVVNDTRGHAVGDMVLVGVARRLLETLRPSDTVSRPGGDEFVVVVEGAGDAAEVTHLATRVERLFDQPFRLPGGHDLFLSASIGVATCTPPDSRSSEHLVSDADVAMYRAKEAGRGRVSVFDESMRQLAEGRMDLEGALRGALERGEFRLLYQPVVAPGGHKIVGSEALLRWDSLQIGSQQPASFIPLAETTGLIVDIGAWVLEEACRQLQRWRYELPRLDHLNMAVNLSPVQLEPSLVNTIEDVLERTATDPAAITLELTESLLMDSADHHLGVMDEVKATGVHLAIDDFGVGYSSLSYLKRFPVDVLKIDQSFIEGLGTDPQDATIVAAITTMADALGLDVVAEGVETARQAQTLHSLGRAKAQGYYYGRPMAPGDLAALMARGRA